VGAVGRMNFKWGIRSASCYLFIIDRKLVGSGKRREVSKAKQSKQISQRM
jgi:hypothetical protein